LDETPLHFFHSHALGLLRCRNARLHVVTDTCTTPQLLGAQRGHVDVEKAAVDGRSGLDRFGRSPKLASGFWRKRLFRCEFACVFHRRAPSVARDVRG